MSNEKKKTILLTIVLSAICAALIGFLIVFELKKDGTIVDDQVTELMEKFEQEFNAEEKTVIYYASSQCGYCELQKPILEAIAEDYNVEYLEIDSATLGAKQRNEILDKLEIEHATPTTVIVQKGKVIDTAVGYHDGKSYVEFFVSNGIIPEDAVYSGEANLTFINYDNYETLINENKTHIIVVGQTTCSHCIAIKPALNKVAGEYDLTINYLNLTDMDQSDYNKFSSSLKEIEYNDPDFLEDGSFGTPLTLIVENGKVKDYISGQRTKSQLVREFKKNGLIKE